MATRSTGERDHAALCDLESAVQGFTRAAGRQYRTLTPESSLRLGVYWALVNSELGYTHEMAARAVDRICKKLA